MSTVVYKWWHLADCKLLQFIKQKQKNIFVNKCAHVTIFLAEKQQMALVVCHSVLPPGTLKFSMALQLEIIETKSKTFIEIKFKTFNMRVTNKHFYPTFYTFPNLRRWRMKLQKKKMMDLVNFLRPTDWKKKNASKRKCWNRDFSIFEGETDRLEKCVSEPKNGWKRLLFLIKKMLNKNRFLERSILFIFSHSEPKHILVLISLPISLFHTEYRSDLTLCSKISTYILQWVSGI